MAEACMAERAVHSSAHQSTDTGVLLQNIVQQSLLYDATTLQDCNNNKNYIVTISKMQIEITTDFRFVSFRYVLLALLFVLAIFFLLFFCAPANSQKQVSATIYLSRFFSHLFLSSCPLLLQSSPCHWHSYYHHSLSSLLWLQWRTLLANATHPYTRRYWVSVSHCTIKERRQRNVHVVWDA